MFNTSLERATQKWQVLKNNFQFFFNKISSPPAH